MKRFAVPLVVFLTMFLSGIEAPGAAPDVDRSGWAAPEFAGIEHWINSSPLTLASLRGKVVIVNFWTFGCSNSQHALPHVVEWYARYRERGLVIVGVHTPEFAHERGRAATEAAVRKYGIPYPVAQDNDSRTWKAYRNRYWPAFYFIDAHGRVRFERFGEGAYEESEEVLRTLLLEAEAERGNSRSAPPSATSIR